MAAQPGGPEVRRDGEGGSLPHAQSGRRALGGRRLEDLGRGDCGCTEADGWPAQAGGRCSWRREVQLRWVDSDPGGVMKRLAAVLLAMVAVLGLAVSVPKPAAAADGGGLIGGGVRTMCTFSG